MKRIMKYLLCITMMLVLTGGLTGCKRHKYDSHIEKTQKEVVLEEGPVVE